MPYAPSGVQGSTVKWKNTTGGIATDTVIPGVTDFQESAEEADTIDVTPINSASEVTLTSFAKPGSATMVLAYDPEDAVHIAIEAASVATGTGKTGDLTQTFANAGLSTRKWTGASVSKFEVKLAAKGALIANVSFKLTGSPVNVL